MGFNLAFKGLNIHQNYFYVHAVHIGKLIFMVAPCINNITLFIVQLMHTAYINC
jgi:hypothetical protein